MNRNKSISSASPASGTPQLMQPPLPDSAGQVTGWAGLKGGSLGMALAAASQKARRPVLIVTPDTQTASQLEVELAFFLGQDLADRIMHFPDWETLPYDVFSPHQDIISERLRTLYQLPQLHDGLVIAPLTTLMHRLPPRQYVNANSFVLRVGDQLSHDTMRAQLENHGYQYVSQVMEHGEFAVRGSILDVFPMGNALPYRIDLFDDEVDSIRTFDPESQRSLSKIEHIDVLPAREFPLTQDAIARFRQSFREQFGGDPKHSPIYQDVSNGLAPAGIEYYLPLFFESTSVFFDFLPDNTLVFYYQSNLAAADQFWEDCLHRYEERRHDLERPLLHPEKMFVPRDTVTAKLQDFCCVEISPDTPPPHAIVFETHEPPQVQLNPRAQQPLARLTRFLEDFGDGRVLIAAETAGRREALLELLAKTDLQPQPFRDWPEFAAGDAKLGITVAPLDRGLLLETPPLAVITEPQIFGEQAVQRRRRQKKSRESETAIRDLTELNEGAPVVHEEHGVGRYLGLQTLQISGIETEFLTLEYAGGDKLYVPVSSLHLISRYSGAAPDQAPLHRLGSEQWQKARQRAAKRARDVAAELLDIYARRAARQGHAFPGRDADYTAFSAAFPFEETPDQEEAINAVLADMSSDKPMDRLVCGDVGFGKTEVAMRAAFIATHGGYQVAVLVPTTLLAQQHYQNFRDRFADWPVRVEVLSRFRSKKEQDAVLEGITNGTVDIVIGTHKLLQPSIHFKQLGLVIIDEEHRFGVRQKERLKALRTDVDVLALSATPIPRTLNMAISELRDLSIIATPPSRRLAIKTFVRDWSDAVIEEACVREIKRGGQVYFLHNDIETIGKMARKIADLVPSAKVRIGHGQMSERELEQVMLDFYHQRFNILVCTTIIETGIDIPSANTMIINRADRFGLAQLYQLRGRVGRSHHRAYAFLIVPPRGVMTADAVKRLEAIESLEELGAGFTLAIHDLEIRGAGELLGEGQSGQIQEVGFSLYTEMLERAIHALRSGQQPELDQPFDHTAEIDLHIPALIPEDYLPDIHSRLVLYKRIANAASENQLKDLQVEMIDRFGLLPQATKNLFQLTELKLVAKPLGIKKIEGGPKGGRIVFGHNPNIEPMTVIKLVQTRPKMYKLDGENRLRYSADLPGEQDRIAAVHQLLNQLAEPSPEQGLCNN